MEVVVRGGRSTRGREATISPDKAKSSSVSSVDHHHHHHHPHSHRHHGHHHDHDHHHHHHDHHHEHPRNRSLKMFNKVQVVYYLTRNGHLEHPHYMEVSHLATQPLRLRDVIDRLTVLRGKAMPCQYSWSCKRMYKNGYVWNDLSENDIIYASEGSEYVLKGSELLQDRDFSEIGVDELQIKGRQQRKSDPMKPKTNILVTNKSSGAHQGHSFRQTATNHHGEQQQQAYHQNYEQKHNTENGDQEEDNKEEDYEEQEEEEEEKGSWNSSNPFLMEQAEEESYSLQLSTSSTNSDKPPPPPPQPPRAPPPTVVVNEDGDPPAASALTRNTVLLHLIACGGGGSMAANKGKAKTKDNKSRSTSSIILPCLKQQLSTRGGVSLNDTNIIHHVHKLEKEANRNQVVVKEEEDEDMMMVRYMSENPRFGNLQSQDKEYFSGTIVESITHHPVVLTKSSSYNEQRSCKPELQVAAGAVLEEDEKEGVKVKGIIKCIPRKKTSCPSTSTKSIKQ